MAKYYRATQRGRSKFKNNTKMGKKFRTRAGKYGCYVYINGKRSHFEESKPVNKKIIKKYFGNKRL